MIHDNIITKQNPIKQEILILTTRPITLPEISAKTRTRIEHTRRIITILEKEKAIKTIKINGEKQYLRR